MSESNGEKQFEDRFLRSQEVCHFLGDIHQNTLSRWVDEGRFPKPHKVNALKFWRLSEVQAFIRSLGNQENQPNPASV